MWLVVVAAMRDERYVCEAMEDEGIADKRHRALRRGELHFITPATGDLARGIRLDGVFFAPGWDRGLAADDLARVRILGMLHSYAAHYECDMVGL